MFPRNIRRIVLAIASVSVFAYEVFCHVGGRCNLGLFCSGEHVYCDQHNICQCKPSYPVLIHEHKCLEARGYKDKCKDPKQCTFKDNNSYCTQESSQSYCDCHNDFEYDEYSEKCLKTTKKTEKTSLSLPIAVVISLAFSSLLCCCLILLHLFRRQNITSRHFSFLAQSSNTPAVDENPPALNDNSAHARSNLLPNTGDPLPSYDVVISLEALGKPAEPIPEDECPPSYEEVIKGAVLKQNETKDIPS